MRTRTAPRRFVTAAELDERLAAATTSKQFDALLRRLLVELDDVDVRALDVLPAAAGEQSAFGFEFLLRGCGRSDPLHCYIRDVLAIPRMERDDETRLARRLEFLRRRFERAMLAAGVAVKCAHEILESSRLGPLLELLQNERRLPGVARRVPAGKPLRAVLGACREYGLAREEFVERNLHVVVAAAVAYRTYGVPLLDLIQEGNAGLIRAVEKFDWRKDVRFRTYAAFWIRQAIERAIASSKGIVRVPNYLQQKLRRLRREGRIPKRDEASVGDVARAFDVPRDVAMHLLQTERSPRSLDAPLGADGTETVAATIAAEECEPFLPEWEFPLLRTRVTEVLSALPDHERAILEYRYGIGRDDAMTLEEVGRLMNVSRERVRQLQVRALRKLQAPALLSKLAGFV